MLTTRFTELVGCTVPIQQAGMGYRLANPRLAAAVSNAGGLGVASVYSVTAVAAATLLDEVEELTPQPFGANFIVRWLDREVVALAAGRARIVEFFYGDPDPSLVAIVHAGGALACWNVGSTTEAVAAVAAGCDLVGVQGVEAGGHVRGTVALFPLLAEVLDAIDVPVIAAGGIASGRSMAAALAAGADAVRVGTRFVAAMEADAHPEYVAALLAAGAADTEYGETFSVGWPDAPHRTLRAAAAAARAFDGEVVGEQLRDGQYQPWLRLESGTIDKDTRGAIAAMPQWAGQGVGLVRAVQPAAAIVAAMAEEAEALLRRWVP